MVSSWLMDMAALEVSQNEGLHAIIEPMKKISVVALKGGVGKSSVVAGPGSALVEKGYKVGFLDIDITGSNLYSALGLDHSPKWQLDSVLEKIFESPPSIP